MQVLIVDSDGCGLDFAMRCGEHGHAVKLFLRPHNGERDRTGDGLVEKVSDWEKWAQWADLIVPTTNIAYMDRLEALRKYGYPIFGPSKESARLEIERGFGMQAFKKAGIEVPPYKMFNGLDEAEEYCWKHDQRFVFKTLGSEEDKSLSYVAKDAADMINRIRRWRKSGMSLKGPCMLQDCIEGIELGVSAWMGKEGFLKPRGENVEHKKLMSGNYGPNTGEMGCYDAETEVLTRHGWKYWPDVTKDDEIASLENGKTVFVRPSEVVSFPYVGPMVCWQNRAIDICVTPNHNMYVNPQQDARQGRDGYKFVQAQDCVQAQYEIKRTAAWIGEEAEFYEIPGYTHGKGNGFLTVPPKSVPMLAWARFLGFYIAEGCVSGNTVNLAQSHPIKSEKARQLIADTGLTYVQNGHGFLMHNAQLARHLKPLGRAWEKRVPSYIKDASQEVIASFLEGYALGDGSKQANGFRIFYTCNRGLADDTQELLLKIGRVGLIKTRAARQRASIAPDGHEIVSSRDQYEVCERVKKTTSWLDARDRTEKMYSGRVYCATVPSHIMYVRRNGKPYWCGNTVMWYTSKSKLFNETLKPLESYLRSIGHIGDVDVNCIVDEKGKAWPLEFTCRLGWPAFYIMTAQHAEPCEWMRDALNGKDTLEVSEQAFVGLLMAQPKFPYKGGRQDEVTGIPIQGITEKNWPHLHLIAAMAGKGVRMEGEKPKEADAILTSGEYVLVISAAGDTVKKARKQAYEIADEINVPNKIIRDDIGETFATEQLPKLQALGYAQGVQ